MWKDTPTVLRVEQDVNSILDVKVRFLNPPKTAREVIFHGVANLGNLKALIVQQAKAWDDFDASLASIPTGVINITPAPPPPPPTPTQDQLDRAAFTAAWQALLRLKRAVDAGLINSSNVLFTDALAAAQAAFKTGYETLL